MFFTAGSLVLGSWERRKEAFYRLLKKKMFLINSVPNGNINIYLENIANNVSVIQGTISD